MFKKYLTCSVRFSDYEEKFTETTKTIHIITLLFSLLYSIDYTHACVRAYILIFINRVY